MKIAEFSKDFDMSSVKCCKCKGHPSHATGDTEGKFRYSCTHVQPWRKMGRVFNATLRPLYPRNASLMFIVQEDAWARRVGLVKY